MKRSDGAVEPGLDFGPGAGLGLSPWPPSPPIDLDALPVLPDGTTVTIPIVGRSVPGSFEQRILAGLGLQATEPLDADLLAMPIEDVQEYLRTGIVPLHTVEHEQQALREALDGTDARLGEFMAAQRREWLIEDALTAPADAAPLEVRAWEFYRKRALESGIERRSLRMREFLAGYRAAAQLAAVGALDVAEDDGVEVAA